MAGEFTKSHVVMTEIVLPVHTNALGTIFGGTLVSWIDTAAAVSAMRYCNRTVVTASIDALHFIAPIKQGDVVEIKASVNFVGRTSCEVGVRVDAENLITKTKYHCCSAYLTFVSLDSNGKPISMPDGTPRNATEKRRFENAKKRRKKRLELKKEIIAEQS